ncbi:adenosylcobinamide-GDP ribazoletransferase [Clostridium sp. DL1XJH146]
MKIVNNFLLYFQFFTRIPINKNLECDRKNFREGSYFLLSVGLLIGAVQWSIASLFKEYLPGNIISIIIIAIPIVLTGALHLDGLGDMFDGFYAFKGGKDKIIEIMKDSRIGTFACAAIVIDILLKISLMEFFIGRGNLVIILILPVISRFTVLLLGYIGKVAKEKGTGNIFIGNIGKRELLIALVLTAIVSVLLLGALYSFIIIFCAILITILFNLYCNKKIGGLTGDTLGANIEIVEIIIGIVYILLI